MVNVKNTSLIGILVMVTIIIITLASGCRLIQDTNNDSTGDSTKVSAISGRVISSNTVSSIRENISAEQMAAEVTGSAGIPNAEVWLEGLADDPRFRTVTDASGTYVFSNVPVGEHRVIIKYVDPVTNTTMKRRSEPVAVSEFLSAIEVPDLAGAPALNIVTGQLRDPEGNFLPEGTVLKLWGETFTVGKNGIFSSPPLPDSAAEGEIIVQLPEGKGTTSFVAPFVSGATPAFVELNLGTSTNGNHAPSVMLTASVNNKSVSRVAPGTVVTLKATGADADIEDQASLVPTWSVTHGSLANGASSFEKLWTVADFSTVATATVEVRDAKNATGKSQLAIIIGLDSIADSIRPAVSLSADASAIRDSAPFMATVTFSEPVSGFSIDDISVNNGSARNFAMVSADRIFTVIITPAGAGTVTVAVAENIAQDAAGNKNTAATNLALINTVTPVLSSEKAITATTIGRLISGNALEIPASTMVSTLKSALSVSANASVEILAGSGGAPVSNQSETAVSSAMVVRVTAQDLSFTEYTITILKQIPVISSINPISAANGDSITITGTGFIDISVVKFGSTDAASFTVNSATSITAVVPGGSGVNIPVTVTNQSGTSNSAGFSYSAPTIAAITPNSAKNGETITLTGVGFGDVTAVKFGNTNATAFTIASPTSIIATVPSGSGSNVAVTVTNPAGTSNSRPFSYPTPAISSISPNPAAIGASITITGTDFTGTTEVKFGTNNATTFTLVSATSITATVPNGSGLNLPVTVVNPSGTSNTASFSYTVPAISSINPVSRANGGSITITGTGFIDISSVKFGSTDAASYTVNSATSITAVVPGGSGGNIPVTVTNPSGTSNSKAFSYSAPTIAGITPDSAVNGATITLTGVGFGDVTAVKFGNTNATAFTIASPTSIIATVPSGSGSNVPVTVINQAGSSNSMPFIYSAPSILSISPDSAANGSSITITGVGFSDVSAVKFGSIDAASFTIASPTSIIATVPTGSGNAVAVTVTNPAGTSNSKLFSYPTPAISAISPTSAAPGALITITGTDFTGTTEVKFGTNNATTFTLVSATSITATVPTGSGLNLPVTVVSPSGTSNSKPFSYPTPAISTISPTSAASGALITITGTDFTGTTEVKFGTNNATAFTLVSATSITATVPTGSGLNLPVTVVNPSGTSNTASFSYPVPTISSINPTSRTNGASIIITGTGFIDISSVKFGSTDAASYTVNSATSVTAIVPSGSGSNIPVTVGNPSGTSNSTPFSYSAPTITAMTPNSAINGATITLTGVGFGDVTAVKFGSTNATSFTIASPTSIIATVPSGSGNNVPVTVINQVGSSNSMPFIYSAPSISSISPDSAVNGSSITITGVGFSDVSAVKFGSIDAASFTIASPTSIIATVPTGSGNAVAVTVTNPAGTSNLKLFSYPIPAISSISHTSAAIGASITITGTDFTGTTEVKFGTTNATAFTINSTTSITATVPAGSGLNLPVTVVSPSGTSNSKPFSYPTPAISTISPDSAAIGASITITGTDLTEITAVKFGATNAAFTINSATSITATVPTGSGNSVAVTVTDLSGTSNSKPFSYPIPAIGTISPASAANGASITITGTDFTGTYEVKFGATNAAFTINSATSITATVPTGSGLNLPVTVVSPSGTSNSRPFSYPAPVLTSISPNNGASGTLVTLQGGNFTGASAVRFGATDVVPSSVSPMTITVIAPAETGTVNVSVTTPSGASANFTFTYP